MIECYETISQLVFTLGISTSKMCNTFVIEYEEPYELRGSLPVPIFYRDTVL